MKHLLKVSTADEGIFSSSKDPLFDKILDDTTPQSRANLIDQAFNTNELMGDPTLMASPAAVNPSLNGTPMSADELSVPGRTTDTMGEVLASYDAGRFAALRKYAQMNLPPLASKATKPKPPPAFKPTQPAAPTLATQVRDAGTAQGIAAAQTHSNAFSGDTPATAPGAANVSSSALFRPTSGPATVQEPPKQANYETPNPYRKIEPTRYSVPPDNGETYSPKSNLTDEGRLRSVSKAFNDLNIPRNADHLNEAGQATIGASP